jgi:hypothetical protein
MIIDDLNRIVNRLQNNERLVFCLRKIFEIATEGRVVAEEDFINWFEDHIRVMNLQQDIHYTFRDNLLMAGRDLDSIYVRGSVGLNMLLRADNNIGQHVRHICGTGRVPIP